MTTVVVVVCVAALLAAVAVRVVWVEAHAPERQQARRRTLGARIEALRLAELEAMWQTPTHTNRRRP